MRSSTNASFKAVTATSLCALFACGGGGSVPNSGIENPNSGIANPLYDYRDFANFRESTVREFTGGTYSTQVTGNVVNFRWGKTVEQFRVVGNWICLDSFTDDGKEPYHIRTVKAEINTTGTWDPLTHPCTGHPYALVSFDKPYSVRVWAYADHLPFFWQHTITPNGLVTNVCWSDALTNTRDTIKQQEVWHDAVNGWHERGGTGNVKDGVPDGTGIVYNWFQNIAKGAGPLWTTSTNVCLVR